LPSRSRIKAGPVRVRSRCCRWGREGLRIPDGRNARSPAEHEVMTSDPHDMHLVAEGKHIEVVAL